MHGHMHTPAYSIKRAYSVSAATIGALPLLASAYSCRDGNLRVMRGVSAATLDLIERSLGLIKR